MERAEVCARALRKRTRKGGRREQRDRETESQRDIERREFEMWPSIVKFACKERTY
jgi:hypothetical protein